MGIRSHQRVRTCAGLGPVTFHVAEQLGCKHPAAGAAGVGSRGLTSADLEGSRRAPRPVRRQARVDRHDRLAGTLEGRVDGVRAHLVWGRCCGAVAVQQVPGPVAGPAPLWRNW